MYLQEGTHEEMPLPVVSVVDWTPRFLAEAGISFGMVKGEAMRLEVFELVDGEFQDLGDISRSDDGRVVMCWNSEV